MQRGDGDANTYGHSYSYSDCYGNGYCYAQTHAHTEVSAHAETNFPDASFWLGICAHKKSPLWRDAIASTRGACAPQNSAALRCKKSPFNFVTKHFVDTSRQDFCSELREAPARWFAIGIVNHFNEFNDPMPQ